MSERSDSEPRVISLPVGRTTVGAGIGSCHVDDWGRDPMLVRMTVRVGRLRWNTTVGGGGRLPARRGALIVVNSRRFALSPILAALALGETTGRAVRFVGRPDLVPFGPLLCRLGGLLDRPDEVAGALRGGELVVIGARPEVHPRRVGQVDHRLVGAAVATGTPVFPAVTATSPLSRRAQVEVGPAIRPARRRRGPLSELELAELVERSVQRLLDEVTGKPTDSPLAWIARGGMG